jgi:protein-tyrosine phosphatase
VNRAFETGAPRKRRSSRRLIYINTEAPLELLLKTILIVCTANVCRSPMAAGILQKHIADRGLSDQVQVISAGVYAEPGFAASKEAIATLRQRGMDIAGHRSQQITPDLLNRADLVLVMQEAHRRSIFYFGAQYLSKVYLLSEMSGGHDDVGDPFGGPMEGYAITANRLEQLIDAGMPQILKRLKVEG